MVGPNLVSGFPSEPSSERCRPCRGHVEVEGGTRGPARTQAPGAQRGCPRTRCLHPRGIRGVTIISYCLKPLAFGAVCCGQAEQWEDTEGGDGPGTVKKEGG